MTFDPNQKNVAPLYLGTVRKGAITYRPATMQKPAQPYAQVGEEGTPYNGPFNAPSLDRMPAAKALVFFGPGAQVVAASLQAATSALPGNGAHPTWHILAVDTAATTQDWGAATSRLVAALLEQHAVAIVALDRDSAHLAEQLALKTFVPVIALSDDRTLTSTNVPWIFRLPSGTPPITALHIVAEAMGDTTTSSFQLRENLASGKVLNGVAFLPSGEPKGLASARADQK